MRGRLITNGVLSILAGFTILYWVITIVWISFVSINNFYLVWFLYINLWISYFWISVMLLTTFVMGIVTLSMKKDASVKGLTITSGILGILGGGFFVGAIISFVAVYKINKAKDVAIK